MEISYNLARSSEPINKLKPCALLTRTSVSYAAAPLAKL